MSTCKDAKELYEWATASARVCRKKEHDLRTQAEVYEAVALEISMMMDEIEKRLKT